MVGRGRCGRRAPVPGRGFGNRNTIGGRGDRGGRGRRGSGGRENIEGTTGSDDGEGREKREESTGSRQDRGPAVHVSGTAIGFSKHNVLKYGLDFVGFDVIRQRKVNDEENAKRFKAFYGVGHKAVAALIKDLPEDKFDLKYLLLALNFAKTYDTEIVMSGWWGLCEDTVRKWAWHYLQKIQVLKLKKVRKSMLAVRFFFILLTILLCRLF